MRSWVVIILQCKAFFSSLFFWVQTLFLPFLVSPAQIGSLQESRLGARPGQSEDV